MMLIKGVRLYGEGDPVDILVRDGVIAEIGTDLRAGEDVETIDAEGQVALPGFVDLHTHLREPGREDTETIASGSAAAALGGYTAVFAMANTDPVADNAVIVEHVWRRGREVGLVDVHPVGAVTVGLRGEKLAELGTMARSQAGVRVFSDDGHCVADPLIMRRALEYTKALDGVIAQHAEEPRLTDGAQAHEGERAARLGLAGWPAAAEESIVARDCLLAKQTGARLHVCHVSTAGTVDVLRWAKERGTKVSAEVTPHHLLLTDERLATYDPVNKVNPPLRTESDVQVLREALTQYVLRRRRSLADYAPQALQLIRPDIVEEVKSSAEFAHPLLIDPRGTPSGKLWHVHQLSVPWEFYDPFGRPDHPEQVAPLYSQPVIELCLRIPTYVLTAGGWDRAIARAAFCKDLPRGILNRSLRGLGCFCRGL